MSPPILTKPAFRLGPITTKAAIRATAIRAAIKLYSIEVAPPLARPKTLNHRTTAALPFLAVNEAA